MQNCNIRHCQASLLKAVAVLVFLCFTAIAPLRAQWTWVPTSHPPDGDISSFAVIGKYLFATSSFATSISPGIYRTTDYGASWTAINNGLPNTGVVYPSANHVLAAIGTNLFVAELRSGVYESTDFGTSWKAVSAGLPSADFVALAVSGSNLFVGTNSSPIIPFGDGVYLSNDNGTSWTLAGLKRFEVNLFGVNGNNLFAATWTGGNTDNVFLSTDNGTSWTERDAGLPDSISVDAFAVCGQKLFAGTSGSGVYVSTDNGVSWTPSGTGLSDPYVLSLLSSGANLYAGTLDGVSLSTDTGQTWSEMSTGLPDSARTVWTLAIIDSNLFAGTANADTALPGVWRWVNCPASKLHLSLSSPDSAQSNQLVTFYLILSDLDVQPADIPTDISAIHFDLKHNDDLLTFVSDSGAGLSMTGSAGLLHFTLTPLVGGRSSPDTIGKLTFRVYLTDSSATPLTLSNISFDDTLNLPHDCIASLDDSGSEFTYIYQCGQGLIQQFMRTNAINFAEQNYPNPVDAASGFNTTIPFTTTAEGIALIRIVDQTGKEVLKDNEEATYAGQHFFYFSAKDLPAGTYYYTIEFPQGVVIANKTMLVVK